MNSEQRQRIRGLVKKYSDSGTESLIAYVAETDGMLAACQALLHSINVVGSTSTEWLQRECAEEDVTFHAFLQEVGKIVALFLPSRDVEDHHAVLGLSADAGIAEIKQAYRTLSRRYHPDTAAPQYRDNPEKFIAINKAYHTLLGADDGGETVEKTNREKQWRQKRDRRISPNQRRGVFIWSVGLLLLLIVVSVVASIHIKKRAMLAGLQESRGAFVPQAGKLAAASPEKSAKVDYQATERPSLSREPVKIPTRDVVAKVQPEPEVDPFSTRPKELRQQDFDSVTAESTIPENNQRQIEQPVEIQPNETKEKIEVAAVPAYSPVRESVAHKSSAEAVDKKISGLHPGVKSNSEESGDKSVTAQTAGKETPGARVLVLKSTDGHAPAIKYQPVKNIQADSLESNVIFNPNSSASAATIIDAKTGDVKAERKAQLAQATVDEVEPLSVEPLKAEPKQKKNDMQTRVDHFFANYINAYEQRNLILFSRFFEGEAEENGKPFTSILPTYLDLFTTTRRITLQVEERTWHLVDGMIAIDGQFKVDLEYADSRKISGSGPIHFLLAENGSELLVRKMEYVFNTE